MRFRIDPPVKHLYVFSAEKLSAAVHGVATSYPLNFRIKLGRVQCSHMSQCTFSPPFDPRLHTYVMSITGKICHCQFSPEFKMVDVSSKRSIISAECGCNHLKIQIDVHEDCSGLLNGLLRMYTATYCLHSSSESMAVR